MSSSTTNVRVAVLVPCFNEAVTVANVVRSFREFLPDASIFVYDNNSTDATAQIARDAGAIVRTEKLQGQGQCRAADVQ